MAYVVLEFNDGVQVVPDIWLLDNEKLSLWPKWANKLKLEDLIRTKVPPERNWASYRVLRIFYRTDDYEKAKEKLELALKISDVEGSASEKDGKKKSCERQIVDTSDSDECDLPPPKRIKPLPIPPTPCSQLQKSYFGASNSLAVEVATNLSETPRTHGTRSSRNEKDFQLKVLYKLNKIIANQQRMEERLTALESASVMPDDDKINDDISDLLPLKTEDDVKNFETLLKDIEGMANVVHLLKGVGGSDELNLLTKIMRKLFTDTVAEKYTWNGKMGKKAFKDLLLTTVILKSIRCHYPAVTEDKVFSGICRYLKYAKQRKERQALKSSNLPSKNVHDLL